MNERVELLFVLASGLIVGTATILFGVRSAIRYPDGLGWDFIWMGLGFNAFMLALWFWLRRGIK